MKRLIVIVVSPLILLLPIFMTSCDNFFNGTGFVYEWVNAPVDNNGEVYVDTEAPGNRSLQPITNAQISFSYDPSNRGKFTHVASPDVTSGSDGYFTFFTAQSPGKQYPYKITITKEGYYPVQKIFTYTNPNIDYSFTIFLVHEP